MGNSIEIIKSDNKILKGSVPIQNDTEILGWLVKSQTKDYKAGNKSLMSDLRKQLKNTFGRQNGTLLFEFRTWAWILTHEGLTYNVFSAPGKGTSVELCEVSYDDMRLGVYRNQIIRFLEKFSETVERPKEK